MKFTGREHGVRGAKSCKTAQRRPNAGAVLWSSEPMTECGLTRVVQAVWDKHDGYGVETLLRMVSWPPERPWGHEGRTRTYSSKAKAVQAAKRLASRLRRKGRSRRSNPAIAILNPLPAHLERFARDQKLNAAEREEFNQAIARYCEFHGVEAEEITIEPWLLWHKRF